MTNSYDDIIHLPHHVSATRPRMPAIDRAAQFSPFAALTGQAREQAQARTLLLTFDQNGKAYQVMHGGPPQRPAPGVLGKIKAFFVNLITRHPDQAATGLADRHKIRDAGPNALTAKSAITLPV